MKLQGDLDSIGVAELYGTLAAEQATGILYLTCPMGRKIIGIADGEISVLCDSVTERSRLGDLLIVRGRITEAQLAEVLKLQRTTELRTPLGDLLLKQKLITEDDIGMALRFQIEEDLNDLFAWKGATFEFDSDKTIDDASAEEAENATIQRLKCDAQAFISDAAKRGDEWAQIESRLPSPYLCFKMNPKGDELAAKANTITQRLVRLIKEGRTVETLVKRSALGRIPVYKALIKMLDDGWIYPFPAPELRFLASEHRANNRFTDALYIYRRLLEATRQENERDELQDQIEETLEAIRKANEAGETLEGMETISFKEAAGKFKRRRRARQIGILVFAVAGLTTAVVLLLKTYTSPKDISALYEKTIRESALAVRSDDFEEAYRLWQHFYLGLPDKRTETAELAKQYLRNIPIQKEAYLLNRLEEIKLLVAQKKLREARAAYDHFERKYPDTDTDKVAAGRKHIDDLEEADRVATAEGSRVKELRVRADKAQMLFRQKYYADAKAVFTELRPALEARPELQDSLASLDQSLKTLREMEQASEMRFKAGEAELAAHRAEQAIVEFELAGSQWPSLATAQAGRTKAEHLKARMAELKQELDRAKELESKGNILEALECFRQVDAAYAEFVAHREAKPHIAKLAAAEAEIDLRVAQARQALERDEARGRALFGFLITEQAAFLAARKVMLPVPVNSYPSGALVKVDGKEAGRTRNAPGEKPLRVQLPVGRPVALVFELPGYEIARRELMLNPRDLENIHVTMSRALADSRTFAGPIHAPPTVIDGSLYVLHGASISALDPATRKVLWTIPELFNANSEVNGAGFDKTLLYPREAPQKIGPNRLLLALHLRDVIEIDTQARTRKTLLTLPSAPVGTPVYEARSLLPDKTLLSAACVDGRVLIYDVNNAATPLYEKVIDPDAALDGKTPAAGAVLRGPATLLALSLSGRVISFNYVNDKGTRDNWNLPLLAQLAPNNRLPASPEETIASFVHTDGRVSAIDLKAREKLWELPVNKLDVALSAVTAKTAIYVLTREGVWKYPRTPSTGKPIALWNRPIDTTPILPVYLASNVYVVSKSGTIFAISQDGEELWQYRCKNVKPTALLEHNGLLYVSTQEGKLLMLTVK